MASPLVEELKRGLDAPICLTWELTYGCNLACIHCLSSSGRRDPNELTTAEAMAVIDELPRAAGLLRQHRWRRADHPPRLLRARRLRGGQRRRGQVLHQRLDDHRRTRPPAGRDGLRRRADLHRRRRRRDQRRGARRGLVCDRAAGDGPPRRRRLRAVQDQRRRHPAQRRPARRARGAGRRLRRPAAPDPAAAVGPGRRHVARAAPHRRAADRPLPLAASASDDAHRRLVLPPVGARRAAARAQPVRRRSGGVPHRPDRRRVRLPVRDPPRVPGRLGARRRRLHRRVARVRAVHDRCASRRRPARAPRAAPTTPARAGAWRPSSSPACRSTAPTPSASTATASCALAVGAGSPSVPRGPGPLGRRSALVARSGETSVDLARSRARSPTARNRMLFGPHETNLGRRRALSDRHVAYYRRRAAGGAARSSSRRRRVHESDWPYERCPLAADAAAGWAAIAEACHAEGALVLAALGHAGGQGSSAYSQRRCGRRRRCPR